MASTAKEAFGRCGPCYITMDLTQLSNSNAGQFPRQQVFDAIDSRKRFHRRRADLWLKYRSDRVSPESAEKVKQRISALLDYIVSMSAE